MPRGHAAAAAAAAAALSHITFFQSPPLQGMRRSTNVAAVLRAAKLKAVG